jgi:chromosome segregation ATPase
MINFWEFINAHIDWIGIAILFLIVLILFIRDFDLTSRRAWGMLLSLSALGGVMLFKALRENRLLEELKKRKRELEVLEQEYRELKEQHKISEKQYQEASRKLEEAKKKMIRDLIRAEKEHENRLKQIEENFENLSADELMDMTENLIK